MFIEPSYPSDTPFVPVKYQLLEPVAMVVEKTDGTQTLHGFGMGEMVEVMEPRLVKEQQMVLIILVKNLPKI